LIGSIESPDVHPQMERTPLVYKQQVAPAGQPKHCC
jgi:hypothetical protein